jgi:hypothetical protein
VVVSSFLIRSDCRTRATNACFRFSQKCVAFLTLPLQNGLLKSFNGKLRDEKLNNTQFTTLHQARVELKTRKTTTITIARTQGSAGWRHTSSPPQNVCASKRHARCVTLRLRAHGRCTTSPKVHRQWPEQMQNCTRARAKVIVTIAIP